MARVAINTGATPNDGTGDSLRAAGGIINNNFLEIYTHLGAGSTTILPAPIWDITSVGINTLKNVGIGTTNPRFALEVGAVGASGTTVFVNGDARVTGIVTANSFRGSGTNLTGIVTSIVAGTNVTISGSTGQVTINASGGGSGISTQWTTTAAGINTLSKVGIGTTNPRFALEVGAVGASGTTLLVNGDARITGILTVGTASITIDGSTNTLTVPNLVVTNSTTGVTASGVGISVRDGGGDLGSASIIDFGDNLTVSFAAGIATITGAAGGGASSQWTTTAAGINTTSNVGIGTTNPTSTLTVNGTLSVSGVSTLGVITGATYYGDASNTVDGRWTLGANGTNDYTFTGIGFTQTANDPTLYLTRGRVYEFVNNSGGSHPFQIRLSNGGSAYNTGVTNNGSASGTIRFEVPFNAPNTLYYQCTNHSGMGGIIYILDQPQFVNTNAGIHTLSSVGIGTTNPTSALTVKGNTSLETLNVSGISTFNGVISTPQLIGDVSASDIYSTALEVETSVVNGISTISGNGTNAYLRYGSINAYTNFVTTYSVSQVGGVPLIFADANSATLSANTTLNASYARIQTLGAGVTVNGTTFTNQLSVSGISTLNSNVSVGGTINLDGGLKLTTNNPTIVGTSGTVGEIKRIGGAPFFYDGSAWREFVLSSGTPVSVPADTEWDNVVFRATFDTDFTDAKFGATPVYVSAGSTIVGAAVTIGTGAYRNIGGNVSGVGVSYAYRSDYDFTGSWTIEFWIYHDSTPLTFESLVSQVSSTNNSGDWTFGMYNTGSNIQWYWQNRNGTYTVLNSVSNATFNTNFVDKWLHYALVREGDNGSLHFYINGTETAYTYADLVIDNDILHINGAGLGFGAAFGGGVPAIGVNNWNNGYSIDAIFDDVRISCGVGTAGQRYTSIGNYFTPTFTPPTTALPTTGTLSSYIQPPGDKYGEIGLGTSPTWRGTSGVTVSQQSSGNYRVSFASSYTNANDYFVLTQGMDQGFASYVGVARSTTHVDFAVNRESDNSAVNTGSLSVQIKNHI